MNAEEVLVAAFVFLAYDTCLTFADEVEHIWPKPHSSPTKWLFIVLRWFTLVALLLLPFPGIAQGTSSARQCKAWHIFHSAALQFVVALMEVILAQRVYAMYNHSRVVGGVLLIAFIVEQAVMAASLAIIALRVTFTSSCVSLTIPPIMAWFTVAPVLYELTLLVLTLARLVSYARAIGWHRAPLHRLLVRDGLWAFLFAFAGFVVNATLYMASPGTHNGSALGWQYAVAAFSGCRLVLNMHTDPALARGSGPAPCPRAVAACTGRIGESAFALTTFLPALSPGGKVVDLDQTGRSCMVETAQRSGAWSRTRTLV